MVNVKLSKIMQSSGFLGRLSWPLMKLVLSVMKNLLTLLARSVLIPLVLAAAESALDAGIHKKCITQKVENKIKKGKKQMNWFLYMLLNMIGAGLLGNMLICWYVY